MFIFTNISKVNLTSCTLKVYKHVKYNQDKSTNGCIVLAMILLTNNIRNRSNCVPKFPAKYANTDLPIKRYTVTMRDLLKVHSLHYVN